MHSVFRIIAENQDQKNILHKVMHDFNAIQEGLFIEMKKYDAISATIVESGSWEEHCDGIEGFILKYSKLLEFFKNENLCYHIDVCVSDCEDIKKNIITSYVCEVDFLKALVTNEVSLEFSYYNTK